MPTNRVYTPKNKKSLYWDNTMSIWKYKLRAMNLIWPISGKTYRKEMPIITRQQIDAVSWKKNWIKLKAADRICSKQSNSWKIKLRAKMNWWATTQTMWVSLSKNIKLKYKPISKNYNKVMIELQKKRKSSIYWKEK